MLSISQQIEKQIATEVAKRHALFVKTIRFGLEQAIKAASKGYTSVPIGPVSKPGALKPTGKRTRAIITAETRTKVKEMVKAKKSASTIAKDLGISTASVQNIKKALGLVKSKK